MCHLRDGSTIIRLKRTTLFIDGIAFELRQMASIIPDIQPDLQPKNTNLALVLLDSVDFGSVCNGRCIARR